MKANEFVKEHGFQYTRNLVRDYPNHTHVTDDGRMFINENECASHIKAQLGELVKIDELKRLVESHEYIESYGSLNESKRTFEMRHGVINLDGWDKLKQAIADVESCQ